MATDMKRVTVLIPEDVYEALNAASQHQHESMSNIGRRLFVEWLRQNGYYEQPPPPPILAKMPGPKE